MKNLKPILAMTLTLFILFAGFFSLVITMFDFEPKFEDYFLATCFALLLAFLGANDIYSD